MNIGDKVKITTSKGGEGTIIDISKYGMVKVLDTENQIRYIWIDDLKEVPSER